MLFRSGGVSVPDGRGFYNVPRIVIPPVNVFTREDAEIVKRAEGRNPLHVKNVLVFFADSVSRHLPCSLFDSFYQFQFSKPP